MWTGVGRTSDQFNQKIWIFFCRRVNLANRCLCPIEHLPCFIICCKVSHPGISLTRSHRKLLLYLLLNVSVGSAPLIAPTSLFAYILPSLNLICCFTSSKNFTWKHFELFLTSSNRTSSSRIIFCFVFLGFLLSTSYSLVFYSLLLFFNSFLIIISLCVFIFWTICKRNWIFLFP